MGSSPRVRGTLQRRRCQRTIPGIIPACAGNTGSSSEKHSYGWDHPRVCGEHSRRVRLGGYRRGSSPRVRGTPGAAALNALYPGIIPACAGNTSTTRARRCRPRDHPRVCGEHAHVRAVEAADEGSSPRVRGTPGMAEAGQAHHGIIPACAGNTRDGRSGAGTPWDHPRVCGEHHLVQRERLLRQGSSPRVRGTQDRTGRHRHDPGIIPACAGNTVVFSNECRFSQDHPRVCGEHPGLLVLPKDTTGSSPRVRGTHPPMVLRPVPDGIIPACAGNTSTFLRSRSTARDHPRVCGEHVTVADLDHPDLGSSPRVRGTLGIPASIMLAAGIIPACAGNTHIVPSTSWNMRDHPRVCGEHLDSKGKDVTAKGSSPRVRGTL